MAPARVEPPGESVNFPAREARFVEYGDWDPTGDHRHSPLPGLVHRYPDRVLVLLGWACPVICPYCFRGDRVGRDLHLGREEIRAIRRYLDGHPRVREVILSGGDPLCSPPEVFQAAVSLAGPSRRLRVHTRFPVVRPRDVPAMLWECLRDRPGSRVILHLVRAEEVTPDLAAFVGRVKKHGCGILAQSPLLAGVNDDPEILLRWLEALDRVGVRPHQLHHTDRTPGNRRYQVSLERGMAVFSELRRLRGNAPLPRYVLDLPGGEGKADLLPGKVRGGPERWEILLSGGRWIEYREERR